MIRDTFFSMPRFVNLCRKEMVESWKANILRLIMMYGILAVFFAWNGYLQYSRFSPEGYWVKLGNDPTWDIIQIISLWAFVIMGLLSASFIMEKMKSKTNRIASLMTPATMFEKFLSRWIVFTFGYLIVFLIAFKLADWTRVLIYMASYPEIDVIAPLPLLNFVKDGQEYWAAFENGRFLMLAISFYCMAQSVFVLGSTIWPKNAFVKTVAACVVIAIVYVSIGATLSSLLLDGKHLSIHPPMTDEAMMTLVIITNFVLVFFNWTIAYFRFKESEIINRW